MTKRQYSEEYFKNRERQAEIEQKIYEAILPNDLYANVIMALENVLRTMLAQCFEDDLNPKAKDK